MPAPEASANASSRFGRTSRLLTAERHPAYLAAVRAEAERAEAVYGMLVMPGLELTYDDPSDSTRSAHAVAVGLERFVSLDRGIGAAIEEARDAGAALIAAHPHGAVLDSIPGRQRRLPRARARRHVEDAPAVRAHPGVGGRIPALGGAGCPEAGRAGGAPLRATA